MTETTIILILLAIACILLCVLLFYRFKDKKDSSKEGENLEVEHSITSLKEQLPLIIEGKIKDEFLPIKDALHTQEKSLSEEFQSFRLAVSESQSKEQKEFAESRLALEKSLRESSENMRKEMEEKLRLITEKVNSSLTDGFKDNLDSMSKIQERLAKIDEAQKHLDALQKDVISLNTVLKGNQTRGRYGEMQLEMLLEKVFPNGKAKGLFELQTPLKGTDGTLIPDAAILFQGGEEEVRLCIDSKFPYEAYEDLLEKENKGEEAKEERLIFKNAVKEKAKQVTKYVGQPGTCEYAVLFIPSEGIYATIQNEFSEVIHEYAEKGVLFASPTILLALIVIVHSNEQEIARNKASEEIRKNLLSLGKEFNRFEARWSALSGRIKKLEKDAGEFTVTVNKITGKFSSLQKGELTYEETPTEENYLLEE